MKRLLGPMVLSAILTTAVVADDCWQYEIFPQLVDGIDIADNASVVEVVDNLAFITHRSRAGHWMDWAFGLLIVDVSTPASPELVSELAIPGPPDFIAVDGNYCVSGGSFGGLQVIDISDPAAPAIVSNLEGSIFCGAIRGNFIYVGRWQGLEVIDISVPDDPTVVGFLDMPSDFPCDIAIAGDHAYVFNGWDEVWLDGHFSVSVLDISTPEAPVQIGNVPLTYVYGEGPWLGRIVVANSHVYATGFFPGPRLYVVDVTAPSQPVLVHEEAVRGAVLAATDGYAYMGASSYLRIYDIATPTAPLLSMTIATLGTVAGIAATGNHIYLADGGAGLQVVDVTDPPPPIIGSIDTPGGAQCLAVANDHAYVGTGVGGFHVVDVAEPGSPQIVGMIGALNSIREVTVVGTHAYIANVNQLAIVDVTEPTSPAIVGQVVTPGGASAVAVDLPYAYIADMHSGLQVIDVTDLTNPQIVGTADTPHSAVGVAVAADHAFIADMNSGLQIVDISNPAAPMIVGTADTPGIAEGVAVAGNLAFVADGMNGLVIVDVADPVTPTIIGSIDTPNYAERVAVTEVHAYVADGNGGLQIVDISEPDQPQLVASMGEFQGSTGLLDVALYGNLVYAADQQSGLWSCLAQCDGLVAIEGESDGTEPRDEPPAAKIELTVFPNPFNPQTTITFSLERDEWAAVSVYELTGRRVAILADRTLTAGEHSLIWSGRDVADRTMPSGTYLVRLETESAVRAQKLMLVR